MVQDFTIILALVSLLAIVIGVYCYSSGEGYDLLSSDPTILTSKSALPPNDSGITTASSNVYSVYKLKDDETLLPIVTTTKGWNPKTGQQDVLCSPAKTTQTFPKNYYKVVDADAVCQVAPDPTSGSDATSFTAVDTATGRMYLKPELAIAKTLRSGSGMSCSDKYATAYGKTLMKDPSSGAYYKIGSTDPICITTPDTAYYTGPTAVDIASIMGNSAYL